MPRVKSRRNIKQQRKVTFSLEAADAKKVVLMGDFNKWNPEKHPMQKD
ncbi:MAG: glycoside hydrolase, partial [Proteobacteria bacterium]|nr:glycoside hydrolase [Pseudomonadota bacterium]